MKRVIFFVTSILIVFTLISLEYSPTSSSSLRLITSSIFFICALGVGSFRKNLGILAFALLPVCDFFLIIWDENYAKVAYYSTHILFLITLLYVTLRVLDRIRITFFDVVVLGLFFTINSYILIYLSQFFSTPSSSEYLKILFLVNGFLIITLVLAAFFFSTNRSNSITSYFFLGVMFLVLSELIIYAIYFMNERTWKYLDNLFYSFSLFFLIRSYYEHITQMKTKVILNVEDEEDPTSK